MSMSRYTLKRGIKRYPAPATLRASAHHGCWTASTMSFGPCRRRASSARPVVRPDERGQSGPSRYLERRRVIQLCRLVGNGLHDPRPRVARIHAPQARDAIEHLAPVVGPEMHPGGLGEEAGRLFELAVRCERHPVGVERGVVGSGHKWRSLEKRARNVLARSAGGNPRPRNKMRETQRVSDRKCERQRKHRNWMRSTG